MVVEKETVDRRKCILRTTAGGSLAVKEMRKKLRLLQKNTKQITTWGLEEQTEALPSLRVTGSQQGAWDVRAQNS